MGIAGVFLSIGCATTPLSSTLPPDASEVLAPLGTIGVAAREPGPDRFVDKPGGKGWAVLRGFGVGFAQGMNCGELFIICSPAGAILGAVAGPFLADSAKEIESAAMVLQPKLDNTPLTTLIQNDVVRLAHEQGQRQFVHMPSSTSPPLDVEANQPLMNDSIIDSHLEITVLAFGLDGSTGQVSINQPVWLRLNAEIRWAPVQDGTITYDSAPGLPIAATSETHTITEWADNDAELFQAAVHTVVESAAQDVLQRLYQGAP